MPELAHDDLPEIEIKTVECLPNSYERPAQNQASNSKTFGSSRWSWESINFIE